MSKFNLVELKIIIFIFIIWHRLAHGQNDNLICTDSYCQSYKDEFDCPTLGLACQVQNSTFNGKLFPSPTACNCCEFCLEHLREGDFCSVGAPGNPVPVSFCGPGLTCYSKLNDDHPKCWPIYDTECARQRIAYDKQLIAGTIGNLMQRPDCDGDGFFKPVKCVPGQICYCVDKNGNRIFGEQLHTFYFEPTMNCECSRISSTFDNVMNFKYPHLTSRCLDDGSFDQLQCIDDQCFCVHSIYGTVESNVYNGSLGLVEMPCFNRNLHKNRTLLHYCEEIQSNVVSDALSFENDGYKILDFRVNICDPNGWFKRVQETEDLKYCSDKLGQPIRNFTVERSSPYAENMNCNCALARELMIKHSITELPECCPNGNYEKVACRRGECYCVDENGNQISKEVSIDNQVDLPCYNDGIFC